MDDPVVIQRFILAFEKRLAEHLSASPDGVKELGNRIREVEERVSNLTEALAKMGWNEHVQEKLDEEQQRLNALKSQTTAKPKSVSVPDEETISGYMKDLLQLLEGDTE